VGREQVSFGAMVQSEIPKVTEAWGADGGDWSILIHGGAGDVRPEVLPEHVQGCRFAASEAARVLQGGGSALNAAQRAVEILEDDPHFNAGTGACLNAEGRIELDAAIMEGTLLRAGAVAACPPFQHPIAVARMVLNEGGHVMYAAEGAERFALARGFARSADDALITDLARERWQIVRGGGTAEGWAGGTVGAVARDRHGTVVAATSTGGKINKAVGRIGDTPVLGAGTYADDEAGACSNTGDGEAVMRLCLAKTACEWMRVGMHPVDAARAAVRMMLARTGGAGGIILVDRAGRMGFARTTPTMTWAAASDGWGEVLAGG
jgi:beta-aspartyl-peptidase (threonine type)